MPRLRAALVGLGYWGKILFPILKQLEKSLPLDLALICDHHRENLATCQERDPAVACFTELDRLLDSGRVDVVFIATQPHTHHVLASRCLERNCHVFLEKPFTRDPKQAEKLETLAASKGLTLMVGYRLLYSPAIAWVKKNLLPLPAGSTIRATWKNWGIHQPGGVHWDLASHYLAVLQDWLGSPGAIQTVRVGAESAGNPEELCIILTYPEERHAIIDVSWNHPVKRREMIVKTPNRMAHIDFDGVQPLTVYEAWANMVDDGDRPRYRTAFEAIHTFDREALPERKGIERQFTNFIHGILDGEAMLAGAALARDVVAVLTCIDRKLADQITRGQS